MPLHDPSGLDELRQRIRSALESEEATDAPYSIRRLLWLAAGMIHRLLRRRRTPKAELAETIRFVGQTLDAWTAWPGGAEPGEVKQGQ